jgi:Xaa-Pro aminopeptidase
MIFGVEPTVLIPGLFGVQLKDMIAVTNDGCELLSDAVSTDEMILIE